MHCHEFTLVPDMVSPSWQRCVLLLLLLLLLHYLYLATESGQMVKTFFVRKRALYVMMLYYTDLYTLDEMTQQIRQTFVPSFVAMTSGH